MAASSPPYFRDLHVPAFTLDAGAKEVSQLIRGDVISVVYSDNVGQLDSAQITLNNWNPELRVPTYTSVSGEHHKALLPGKEVDLHLGYRDGSSLTRMISGVVTGWSASFPQGGSPTLTVSVINRLFRTLRGSDVSQHFMKGRGSGAGPNEEGTTDIEIFRRIAARAGIAVDTDAGPPEKRQSIKRTYSLQENTTDLQFLFQLASEQGFYLAVLEGNRQPTMTFRRSTSSKIDDIFEFTYGQNLTEFSPKLNVKDQYEKVEVHAAQRRSKGKYLAQDERPVGVIDEGYPRDFADAVRLAYNGRVNRVRIASGSPSEAKAVAEQALIKNAKEMITASGRTVGLPRLRAGTAIAVKSTGVFDGRYFVTSTQHTFGDSGYSTSFHCRREGRPGE